jgi:peptidoglycan hydrolase CwlO-like protein
MRIIAFLTILTLGCCVYNTLEAQDCKESPNATYKVTHAQWDELQRRVVALGDALTKSQAKIDKLQEENSKLKKGCNANSDH